MGVFRFADDPASAPTPAPGLTLNNMGMAHLLVRRINLGNRCWALFATLTGIRKFCGLRPLSFGRFLGKHSISNCVFINDGSSQAVFIILRYMVFLSIAMVAVRPSVLAYIVANWPMSLAMTRARMAASVLHTDFQRLYRVTDTPGSD
ncbi:MAG: hypothetical protein ACLR1G_00900 [Alistipes indistinctus]